MDLPPKIPKKKESITEKLAGAGFKTYGGFGHDTPFVSISGRFEHHEIYHKVNSTAEDVLQDYISWLRKHRDEKTFGYIHLADPHIPVDPSDEYWEKYDVDRSIDGLNNWKYRETVDCNSECERYRQNRWRLYKAAVNEVDDALADFNEGIESMDIEPKVFYTSDHGEMFWEHLELDLDNFKRGGTIDHGGTPYEELTRVPLLTKNIELDIETESSLIDLAPTILELADIENELDMTGRSLFGDEYSDRLFLVESSLKGYEKKAVYRDKWKLIISKGDDVSLGFSLPEEEIKEIPEEIADEMYQFLPNWPGEHDEGEGTEVSGIVENRLEELGYK